MTISTIIFDFGNVINIWEPHAAVAALYPTPALAAEAFEKFSFEKWIAEVLDAGADPEQALAALKSSDRDKYELLKCYLDNIALAHKTPVPGTSDIIRQLKKRHCQILGMTNCGLTTFDALKKNFDIIELMDDVFVSAKEKVSKPDPYAFHLLLERNGLTAEQCLFVDDKKPNVDMARILGIDAILFTSAAQLNLAIAKRELAPLGASL